RFTRTGRRWLLRKPFVADGRVQLAHSVIERVELPAMASFHRVLGCLLGREPPAPPPRVTLDGAGQRYGIGVSGEARVRALGVRDVSGPLWERLQPRSGGAGRNPGRGCSRSYRAGHAEPFIRRLTGCDAALAYC